MTYVELIVVLAIFSIMTSIVLFNYGTFQEKVDIKVLANNIASKIVEAQKSATSGQMPQKEIPIYVFPEEPWRPAYGVYFNLDSGSSDGDGKSFTYFTDLDKGNNFTPDGSEGSFCSATGTGECIDYINIEKNNKVSDITIFYTDGSSGPINNTSNFSITFTRPKSEAVFSLDGSPSNLDPVDYVQITLLSNSGIHAYINVYSSGRVQIN